MSEKGHIITFRVSRRLKLALEKYVAQENKNLSKELRKYCCKVVGLKEK